jgi:protein-S-isoprenylcysteine O-methyltransferase Ste14
VIVRAFALAGGALFAASIGYFLWFYLFGLDARAATRDLGRAVTLNVTLFTIFALHHSVFARAGVRSWMARRVSPRLERSIYVWIASVAFGAVCLWWAAIDRSVWDTDGVAHVGLRGMQFAGVAFTLWAAGALDSLSLAGIRQLNSPLPASGVETTSVTLQHTGPYGVVRHPIYFGWLLIVWPAPTMTVSHLIFAILSTAYLVAATFYEERSLHQTFGPAYADYARKVRRKMIPGLY